MRCGRFSPGGIIFATAGLNAIDRRNLRSIMHSDYATTAEPRHSKTIVPPPRRVSGRFFVKIATHDSARSVFFFFLFIYFFFLVILRLFVWFFFFFTVIHYNTLVCNIIRTSWKRVKPNFQRNRRGGRFFFFFLYCYYYYYYYYRCQTTGV